MSEKKKVRDIVGEELYQKFADFFKAFLTQRLSQMNAGFRACLDGIVDEYISQQSIQDPDYEEKWKEMEEELLNKHWVELVKLIVKNTNLRNKVKLIAEPNIYCKLAFEKKPEKKKENK